uniref:Uncharacterized protein n=1 Tax=Cajanus cajan TaxID=3821 RepID=A0A151SGX9_CAJCA|nr:hypothetical protein KK1_000261 [Cajanus cajan]
MENSSEAKINHGKAHATTSSKGTPSKKEKILSIASYHKNYFLGGFGAKTLGVSPLSMTRFKPQYYNWHHIGLKHDHHHQVSWSGHQTLNSVHPTIDFFQDLMAEGNGFHQHHKSCQPFTFPLSRGGAQNSESQSQLSLNLSLCVKRNFDLANKSSTSTRNATITMADDLNPKTLSDGENSSPANGVVEELDLTLKI